MTHFRLTWLALPLAFAALSLAGCADSPPSFPVHHFDAPSYAHLTKMRLNVARIHIEDRTSPSPTDVSASASPTPAEALAAMARDRLVAAGTEGTAIFAIDTAGISKAPDGTLEGVMAVHLDISAANSKAGGYAEARAAANHTPGSDPEDGPLVLHDLVTQMMSDMNVEFEFQLRKSLREWMLRDGAAPASVQRESLAPPPAPAAGSAAGNPAEAPPAPDGAKGEQTPPPAGVLRLPGQ